MRDEIEGRLWVAHGPAFSASVAGFFAEAARVLKRLHDIEFAAPWKRDAEGPGQA